MRFGIHIRTAGGLIKALNRAEQLKCECAQLFSANPNSWSTRELAEGEADSFKNRCAELNINPIVLHTPYLLNLASPDDEIWDKSRNALAFAMKRASDLNAESVVTHIGSHKGAGIEYGVARIAEAVRYALDAGGNAHIALELGSGAGRSIGSNFAEIAMILEKLGTDTPRVGVCIDAAHLFGAGFDISTAEGVEYVFNELHRYAGCERLRVVHLNDTVQELGSLKDRHYHVGKGNVGLEGFRAIVNHPCAVNVPGIIETPGDDDSYDQINLDTLRNLRNK